MATLKVVVPMAGLGKRLGGLTKHKPKALVRLTDQRLLDHVLFTFKQLEKTYTLEYIFITGFLGEQIKEYMQQEHPDKKITYFRQDQLLGQSHAVYLAKEAISGPILLTFCDTINELDLSFLPYETAGGIAFVQEVDDPRRHGVAVTGPDHLVTKLVEKPQTMEYRLALTGFYYFREGEELIKAIEAQIQRSESLNNEYYLADAINIMMSNGIRVRIEKALQWLDAGTPEALIDTNAHLLKRRRETRHEAVEIQGNILIHPVYIHESARVENSIIGPNVTVGMNCLIQSSILKDTVVDDDSRIMEATLKNSLVGKGCTLNGKPMQAVYTDYSSTKIYSANDEVNSLTSVG